MAGKGIGAAILAVAMAFVMISLMLNISGDLHEKSSLVVGASNPALGCDYVIFVDGSTYYAKNGTTGAIDYRSTNASSVIQSAIDAVNESGGGEVCIKSGTYVIDYPIQMYGNMTLSNHGNFTMGASASVMIDIANYTSMAIIDGGLYYGDSANHAGYTWMIGGQSTNSTIIRNCQFVDIHYEAINCDNWFSAIIEDCVFKDAQYAALRLHSGNSTVVRDCTFEDMQGTTFGAIFIDSRECLITGCDFKGSPGVSSIHFGLDSFGDKTYNNTGNIVSGCSFRTSGGISINFQSVHTAIYNNIICNNYFGNGTHTGINKASYYTLITDNQFRSYDRSIQDGDWYICENNVFNGSSFGIRSYSSDNCTIRNNLFVDCNYGFYQDNGGDNYLMDNRFSSCTYPVSRTAGTLFIEGNLGYVSEASGAAVISSGGTYVDVMHGMRGNPTMILITGTTNDTKDAYIISETGTGFRIQVPGAVAADSTIYWYAEYHPWAS